MVSRLARFIALASVFTLVSAPVAAQDGLPPLPPPLPPPPPSYDPPLPPPLEPTYRVTWGTAFRLDAAPLGGDAAQNARMGGIGVSLRPRFGPTFALDFGLDFVSGTDFNGEHRDEQSFTVDPIVFLTPRYVISPYLLAGFGVAAARVEHARAPVSHYRYIGVNGGAGVEARFWRRIGIDLDFMAFVRDHTDSEVAYRVEFYDPATGRTSNTSKGVLVRLGLVYEW